MVGLRWLRDTTTRNPRSDKGDRDWEGIQGQNEGGAKFLGEARIGAQP